jgi:type IV secretory pathway VirJ component
MRPVALGTRRFPEFQPGTLSPPVVTLVTRGARGRQQVEKHELPTRSLSSLYSNSVRAKDCNAAQTEAVFLHLSRRNRMLRKLMLVAATLAVPALLAAQDIPNSHASDTAKSKVAAHRQNPQVPAQEASDTAKSKVAQHRASTVRGSALGTDNRPVTPAVPATPATPSSGGSAGTPASPATPATPAVPASPSKKPSSPGSQAGSHRP